jgi:hypothetical protein
MLWISYITSHLFLFFAAVVVQQEDGKDASTGIETNEKRNRFKRAAKGELTPPKMKKIKVSQDIIHIYDKFVINGRRFKRQKKNATP